MRDVRHIAKVWKVRGSGKVRSWDEEFSASSLEFPDILTETRRVTFKGIGKSHEAGPTDMLISESA